MVLKIRKKNRSRDVIYKGSKKVLTPQDIKQADRFDVALEKSLKDIEQILIREGLLAKKSRTADMLEAWYLIGKEINVFLDKHQVLFEEEGLFWEHLYGRSSIINKTVPKNRISVTRNDFKIASRMARYPFKKLQKIGLWAIWREVLSYKAFRDERVLNWVIKKIESFSPKTRNEARPFLKAVAARLKKIDTSVLNDKELQKKFATIQY